MNVQAIDTFHKTRLGYFVFGLVELGFSYVLANLALDSGSLWEWVPAFIFLFGFLQNLVRLVRVR